MKYLKNIEVTDEVSAVTYFGKPVKIVQNEWINLKVTFPEDLNLIAPS